MSKKKQLTFVPQTTYDGTTYITGCYMKPVFYVQPHWHGFYEIELILNEAQITINDTHYIVPKNSLYFISIGDIHEIDAKKDSVLCSVAFDIESISNPEVTKFIKNSSSFTLSLSDVETKWFCEIMRKISLERKSMREWAKLHMQTLLTELIASIMVKQHSSITADIRNNALQNAIKFINQHYKEDITRSDVAVFAFISEDYLTRLFKTYLNTTFKQFLTNRRIHHARNLLINTSLSVSDISIKCGFNSSTYFIDCFKKSIGMTPRAFREQIPQHHKKTEYV